MDESDCRTGRKTPIPHEDSIPAARYHAAQNALVKFALLLGILTFASAD